MSSTVSGIDTVRIVYRVILRQLLTRGRVSALVVIGAVVALLGWLVGRASPPEEFPPLTAAEIALQELEAGVFVVSLVGFTLLVPIVALVFAGASLGDTREDGTLVYLWLRPMPRAGIAVGAWLAAITVSLPLTLVPMTLTAYLLDTGSELVAAAVIATIVGIIAYSAIFVMLGLVVKNSIVWGLGYILIWEGLVASFGSAAAKVAVRGYLSSVLTDRTGVDIELGDLSQTAGIVVPLVVAVVALALATYRLNNLEVA
jgi:ABC-2 type transport system permease protein